MKSRNVSRSRSFWSGLVISVIVFCLGSFFLVETFCEVIDQKSSIAELRRDTLFLNAKKTNIEHVIANYHDLDRIRRLAVELGMQKATDSQIRYVRLNQ